ncbi:Type IV secretory pathway VirD4 protein-like protein [Xylanimonas cellulosilytica DSM 15894]|uniref:Type IV secretory pathway VirD4 protein-like protein n=1 Tax=Xylanimonas cellulosilytica (strain DSM 15894 / JCM 12276 / CECT 5975 / KCTC 9989 / LMG 20990 / NBRC 107835 / XIL07) TaxID=446471 RepID=D1BXM8_XYLCX|nr:TraM recognition domain-containing protein [Xylanimonas cellulosilytica]ACZ29838.1 Type IV secretory pathway VirD4 protein-like protein [Xylanimonas cellulosilytica DSM 15894]
MTTTAPSGNDSLTNLGLILVGAAIGIAGALRVAGSIAARLAGTRAPDGGLEAGLRVLAQAAAPAEALDSPGLSPVLYWAVVAVLLAVVVTAALMVWRFVGHRRRRNDPHLAVGTATRADVAKTASARALVARAKDLRPSLATPTPADLGYLLGRCNGKEVWASVEDSILVLGPPRSGKGLHLVINAILDAPGAVVSTSTRPDNLAITMTARARRGPVAVFDPQRLASSLPSGLRWSPLRGCEDPETASIRAAGFAASTGLSRGGGVESGSFWEGKARTALQALLHAGALGGRDARELYTWSVNAPAAADAVAILHSHPDAAPGWAESLEATIHADPRTRESVWIGVGQALACLANPATLDAVTPRTGEHFSPAEFLRSNGTLYLLATGAGSKTVWPLIAAFVEDLVQTASRLAAASPGSRLDPPLLLSLDEIGNLAPLPSLPHLMSEGGGTGITTMPVLQSLELARENWGRSAAGAIWDAAITKVILGGSSSADDLRALSALIGERDEVATSTTIGPDGTRSTQRSSRRVPVLPPEHIRTLPFGVGLTLLRSTSALVTDLRPWTVRDDVDRLMQERAATETLLRQPS